MKKTFEEYYQIKIEKNAIISAVELSDRYILDKSFPDKALDIIDEVGAYYLTDDVSSNRLIEVSDIELAVSKMVNIPVKKMSESEKESLLNLEKNLKSSVFGQDDPIEKLSSTIKIAYSGLKDTRKPIASLVFAGSTGVGKTEIVRKLAENLNVELIRLDMSEYMEKQSISRLIGAAPGYIGYEEGGLLTELVNKKPYSIVLLDEIEKAHHDIYNILLQVMDNGILTDSSGRTVDFRNTILIMTTNIGAAELEKKSMGFFDQDISIDRMNAIKTLFSPEFCNRLDSIIQFNKLAHQSIEKVVEKFLSELSTQLEKKGVVLNIGNQAKKWICDNGYDSKLGARPIQRLIQEVIKKPLADEILFGKLQIGGVVNLDIKDNKPEFFFDRIGCSNLELSVDQDNISDPKYAA